MKFTVTIVETVERTRTFEVNVTKKSVVEAFDLTRDDDWLDHVHSFVDDNWEELKASATGGEDIDNEELIDTQIEDVQEAE